MTKREAAIITAYTGIFIGDFGEFHKYAEEVMNQPIMSHEFGDREFMTRLKKAAKPDFIRMSKEIT